MVLSLLLVIAAHSSPLIFFGVLVKQAAFCKKIGRMATE
jgi:hypothetical protein